ncbi:MAG: MFS transporter [Gammaproteobacteria bacterium]|jgi:MFS family permease|nr:MFS transporter [Gammaproteobacteria bacterium]
MKALYSVTSLLFSTAFLLLGHGMMLTLLPLRAELNDISEFIIGVSGSAYFSGFIVGCFLVPRMIARVGHIRCFGVLAAAMIITALALEMLDSWLAWLSLRFVIGVAICGLYAVIESWLTSEAAASSRGQVLAIYTFITLAAITAGQFLVNVGPLDSAMPFSLAAIFMALAIIPLGMTRRIAPAPVPQTQTGIRLLYRKSHSAFFGALLAGLVAGSFWSLGPVYASSTAAQPSDVTWFMIAAILGGALMQYPWGWLSDRIDRRHVLLALGIGVICSSVAVALGAQQSWYLLAVAAFGATAMCIYAIALATAADVSSSDEFVAIATSVLLTHSIGAATAPIILGQVMTLLGPQYLFWSAAVIATGFSVVLAVFSRQPRVVSVEEQTPFSAAAADAAPASFELDPRSAEHEEALLP